METWKEFFKQEKSEPYFQSLIEKLNDRNHQTTIYPPPDDILNAFHQTPLKQVKAVILGQDPYHNPGEAHGLSFSVREGVPFPPSLCNVFKELENDLGIPQPHTGNLTPWAKEGVLLLNSILTVEENRPLSHRDWGWEILTDKAIRLINNHHDHVVFILWGNSARKKKDLITKQTHLVIESPHPSPLSAHRGFFGSKPFSRTNRYLNQHNIKEIDWRLSS